ncbi:L-lactate dehydrogenase [Clostridium cavendishii DSM 21758]|uniref:L-lactate dehydrogenase n=1 Tax=Clostridium cavendishii DSM 21758 TaxID=1121302 RepID=A0A1M6VTH4_9CLOT|nr:L-lactate dehydrogenase [Clostridium cavendishii]SHK84823.1 L-lactate dehydrogenase [Clostridium cavendishii DSM 21758]
MTMKLRKVAIVGTGLVGSSCAFSLINQCVCEEILMIDINEERAKGEAWDITHAVEYMPYKTKVYSAKYEECKDVDAIIITAGAPPKLGQTRLDTLGISAKICRSIVEPIMESGFNGFFILVSNPVDIIAYHVWKLSGLPKNKIIGTGTSVDSARLKTILSEKLEGIDTKSIQAFSMGEHGDSQMVPWSHISVAGEPFLKMIDKNDKLRNINLDEIVTKTAKVGWEIYERKGTTYYGIAAAAIGIIKSIFHDEKRIIPVSAMLNGEYGEENIYTGVPCIIGKNGVEKVIEIEMTEDELVRFKRSNSVLREYMSTIGY